jgi:hypothetical protein
LKVWIRPAPTSGDWDSESEKKKRDKKWNATEHLNVDGCKPPVWTHLGQAHQGKYETQYEATGKSQAGEDQCVARSKSDDVRELIGDDVVRIRYGQLYEEFGAYAIDNREGIIDVIINRKDTKPTKIKNTSVLIQIKMVVDTIIKNRSENILVTFS